LAEFLKTKAICKVVDRNGAIIGFVIPEIPRNHDPLKNEAECRNENNNRRANGFAVILLTQEEIWELWNRLSRFVNEAKLN